MLMFREQCTRACAFAGDVGTGYPLCVRTETMAMHMRLDPKLP